MSWQYLCNIKLQDSLKYMTQLSKRSLRERRPPKSFDSDNEDQDPWGYAKHSYSKEQKNPTQQLNSDARLFVKFLTAINKSYKEHEAENRKKDSDSIREPVPLRERKPKTAQGDSELQKRQRELSGQARPQSSKKVKDAYSFKEQSGAGDNSTPRVDLILNKCKAISNESASKMLSIERSINKNRQMPSDSSKNKLDKMQTTSKEMSNVNNFKKANSLNNSKNDQKPGTSPFQSQHSFFSISKQKQDKVNELTSNLNIPKPNLAENKIFKRSAYHVAIAYHIYLNKLRQKGSIGNEIDPTYYARRLKEGMHKY